MATRRTRPRPGPLSGYFALVGLGLDCQFVIAERMARLAKGDTRAVREAQRMIVEKAVAAFEALLAPTPEAAAQVYVSAVRANRRRLSRRA